MSIPLANSCAEVAKAGDDILDAFYPSSPFRHRIARLLHEDAACSKAVRPATPPVQPETGRGRIDPVPFDAPTALRHIDGSQGLVLPAQVYAAFVNRAKAERAAYLATLLRRILTWFSSVLGMRVTGKSLRPRTGTEMRAWPARESVLARTKRRKMPAR